MRRAALALVGTVTGTVLLVAAKTGAAPPSGRIVPSTSPTGGLRDGSFTGVRAIANAGEAVTVTVRVHDGRVTTAVGSCEAVTGQSSDICAAAVRRLQREALSAQSADIHTVSGATYTSDAYRMSLQSALDRART